MSRLIVVILSLLLAAPVLAQTPAENSGDPRIQTIPYQADHVVPLKVAPNFQLTVVFPGEQVENVAIGDSDAWQVTLNRRADALFLKLLRANGVTNMTVITNARVYSFELSPAYGPDPGAPFTVRFAHPEDSEASTAAPVAGRYRLSGARALRPAAVTDDGVRTFIDWPPAQPIPAVFALDQRGDQILLEGHMRDGRYVIDAVHSTLIFRLERQTARAVRQRPRAPR